VAEHNIYLTYDWLPKKNAYLAIISRGQPRLGDQDVMVLTVELCKTPKECKRWYRRMLVERPWEQRS
jgi:hypothetical protein